MNTSCCFCGKTEDEVPLIEIASNSLLIGNSYYEFSQIFQDLLGIVSFIIVYILLIQLFSSIIELFS